ncbi:MAG: SEC-C domain-containing protein [Chlamydiia bacterium]|nr:SEC-C domain-containing protein [Chlamydiia bacterium]
MKRNALCPCGSQKKYKHCCLKEEGAIASLEYDVEWQRVRQIEGKIWEAAYSFALKEWGEEILEDGWDGFSLEWDLKEDSPDGQELFPGWFIFQWVPFNYSEKWAHLGKNLTIADLYLLKHPNKEYERFLSAVHQSPYSFFLVEDVIPSKRLILKDLILDKTMTIKEKSGADISFKGTVVFGRTLFYMNQSIQIGLGTVALPIRYAMDVLDLREEIIKKEKKLTADSLIEYEEDLRAFYFQLCEAAFHPPKLCNNDGDPIVLCTLHYTLKCSPKDAFTSLISLCKSRKPKEILEEGRFDKNRELIQIDFPWINNRSSNLILGHIEIKRDKLKIDVNSVERSEKIKKEIKKRLPEAFFKKMSKQSLETLKDKKPSARSKPSDPSPAEKKAMQHLTQSYYQNWLSTSVPALRGKTPREATQTPEGRKRLELLLLDFEMSNQKNEPHCYIDVQSLRKELGLLRGQTCLQD